MGRVFDIFKMRKENYNRPVSKMSAAISLWSDMYENKSHNGEESSLNIASSICSELARLATVEFSSKIFGSIRGDYLNERYQKIIDKSRVFLEYACAKGGIILKPYIVDGEMYISVVQADSFVPVSFNAKGDIDCAIFYERINAGKCYYTRIEEHRLTKDGYFIKNTAYESKTSNELGKEIPLGAVREWRGLERKCRIENVDRPLFSYLRMPKANTIDPNSELGVCVFSQAVKLIKDADRQYNNLLWEFESGKRALYLDECAIRPDAQGGVLPDDRLYRMLSTGDDTLFKDWTPSFREENIIRGLDRILRSIEFNCGLAYGTLSDVQNVDKTAEEIKASKQRSYSTVCDIQNALEKALLDLIDVMNIYCDIYELCPGGEYSVSFDFDDSIICDRNTEFNEKLSLVDKEILKPWEMRSWYMNEDKKTAEKRIGEINDGQGCNNLA